MDNGKRSERTSFEQPFFILRLLNIPRISACWGVLDGTSSGQAATPLCGLRPWPSTKDLLALAWAALRRLRLLRRLRPPSTDPQ